MTWESLMQFCREEDLRNLLAIFGIKEELRQQEARERILSETRWAYHSKTRANAMRLAKTAFRFISRDKREVESIERDTSFQLPGYDVLIRDASRKLKAYREEADLDLQVTYLCDAILSRALWKMDPPTRRRALALTMDSLEIAKNAGVKDAPINGPVGLVAVLGAAQVSQFGIYLAATTTLGFVTHAIGLTLPFAVYTGMTSTIAVAIGPAGWLAASVYGAFALTEPEWTKVIAVLMYLSVVRARQALQR